MWLILYQMLVNIRGIIHYHFIWCSPLEVKPSSSKQWQEICWIYIAEVPQKYRCICTYHELPCILLNLTNGWLCCSILIWWMRLYKGLINSKFSHQLFKQSIFEIAKCKLKPCLQGWNCFTILALCPVVPINWRYKPKIVCASLVLFPTWIDVTNVSICFTNNVITGHAFSTRDNSKKFWHEIIIILCSELRDIIFRKVYRVIICFILKCLGTISSYQS